MTALGLLAFVTCVGVMVDNDNGSGSSGSKPAEARPKSPEELRKQKIESQFSSWDGSHRALEKVILEAMDDPDSYEHVETRYSEEDDYLIVQTTFRGKNAFGGTVKNWVRAKVSLDGEILEIIAQGP